MINRGVQVLLILLLLGGINYLASRYYQRWDLTENRNFALAAETMAYLGDLQQPIRVYVTIPTNSARREEQILYRNISRLLQDFAFHSRRAGQSQIEIEFIDIYQNLARADHLFRRYGMNQINAVLVASDQRQRLLMPEDLLDFRDAQSIAFRGEAALISAIVEVTQLQSPVLYFLQGHNEVSPDNTSPQIGLSRMARELRLRNFTLLPLDLSRLQAVPDDAAAVIIADPKGPLRSATVEKLRTYLLQDAGRILLWLRPGLDANLEPLLREWGLTLPDMAVHEPDPAYREPGGTLLLRNIGQHPGTAALIANQAFVVTGWSRPVLPHPGAVSDESLRLTALLATSAQSWATGNYLVPGQPVRDQQNDLSGPVPIAMAAERSAAGQLGIQLAGGRMVVIGSGDLFSNQFFHSVGNQSLFFGTLNWLLDRNRMLTIQPRLLESYQLIASETELQRIGLLFLAVPGAFAILGLFVYWVRQS